MVCNPQNKSNTIPLPAFSLRCLDSGASSISCGPSTKIVRFGTCLVHHKYVHSDHLHTLQY